MSITLSKRLQEARAILSLTQRQAADAWGIPLPTLRQWEQDKRTPRGLALTMLLEKLDAILAEPPKKLRKK